MNEPCFIATFLPEVSVSEGCRFNQAQSTKVHCTFSLSIVAILIDFDAGSDQKGIKTDDDALSLDASHLYHLRSY